MEEGEAPLVGGGRGVQTDDSPYLHSCISLKELKSCNNIEVRNFCGVGFVFKYRVSLF